jgi:protein-disulfide isomerase
MVEKKATKKEAAVAKEAKTQRAYVKYVSDPVFVGLLLLVVLMAIMAVYFATSVNCPKTTPVVNDTGIPSITPGGAGECTPENTTGKLVVYEFSEFQCPYCSAAAGLNPTLEAQFKQRDANWQPPEPEIREQYKDDIAVVFKHYIVHGETAAKAAEATECARDQCKFWEMHDKLFQNQQKLEVSDLKAYADELGLDTAKFDACLDSGEKRAIVDADSQLGKDWGVTGTPSFFVGGQNGYNIKGAQSFSEFNDPIGKALQGIMPPPPPQAGPSIGTFDSLIIGNGTPCTEDGKPVIRMFSTTWCPHCQWAGPDFDAVAQEYAGRIVARHWQVDTKDDALTAANETSVPDSELAMYEQFNPEGSIPTFVFGCKYYRVGTGYEQQNDHDAERAELRQVIDTLLNETVA